MSVGGHGCALSRSPSCAAPHAKQPTSQMCFPAVLCGALAEGGHAHRGSQPLPRPPRATLFAPAAGLTTPPPASWYSPSRVSCLPPSQPQGTHLYPRPRLCLCLVHHHRLCLCRHHRVRRRSRRLSSHPHSASCSENVELSGTPPREPRVELDAKLGSQPSGAERASRTAHHLFHPPPSLKRQKP